MIFSAGIIILVMIVKGFIFSTNFSKKLEKFNEVRNENLENVNSNASTSLWELLFYKQKLMKPPSKFAFISEAEEKVPEIDVEGLRRQLIRQKAKELKLLSIMQSEQGNCCMIGSKILYEGDSIKDFYVRRIGNNSANLEYIPKRDEGNLGNPSEPVEIILKLSE